MRQYARRPKKVLGVILLLVAMASAGVAAMTTRFSSQLAYRERQVEVDALYNLVIAFKQVLAYKYNLIQGIIASEQVASRGVNEELFEQLTGQDFDTATDEQLTFFLYTGLGAVNEALNPIDTTLPERLADESYWNWEAGDVAALEESLTLREASAYTVVVQQVLEGILPSDLGFGAQFLPCNSEDGGGAEILSRICWDGTVDADDPDTSEHEDSFLHFWVDVGDGVTLMALINRLRISDLSDRSSFCPVRRQDLFDQIDDVQISLTRANDPEQIFTLRCDEGIDQTGLRGTVSNPINVRELPTGLVMGEETVLLVRHSMAALVTELDLEGVTVVVPPSRALWQFNEISALTLIVNQLRYTYDDHDLRGEGSGWSDITNEMRPLLAPVKLGNTTVWRYEPTVRVSRFLEKLDDASIGWIQNDYDRCYRHLYQKLVHSGSSFDSAVRAVESQSHLVLPNQCVIQAGYYHADEYLTKLGTHVGHETTFGFEGSHDAGRRYSPHLTFGNSLLFRDIYGTSSAPVARGSIISKWMFVRHLMGEVHLVPGVGAIPWGDDLATESGDVSKRNVTDLRPWPGFRSKTCEQHLTVTQLDYVPAGEDTEYCAFLTISPGTVVFSETLVGSDGLIRTSQAIPEDGEFWQRHGVDKGSLAAIRPYRYRKISADTEASHTEVGFLAQEVASFYPDLVRSDSGGYLAMSYYGLLPILYAHLRSLERAHDSDVFALNQRLKQVQSLVEENDQSGPQHVQ
ncbi:MAG: tail fiber domain-containing protein [Gammaproteobacteria bacterium]